MALGEEEGAVSRISCFRYRCSSPEARGFDRSSELPSTTAMMLTVSGRDGQDVPLVDHSSTGS